MGQSKGIKTIDEPIYKGMLEDYNKLLGDFITNERNAYFQRFLDILFEVMQIHSNNFNATLPVNFKRCYSYVIKDVEFLLTLKTEQLTELMYFNTYPKVLGMSVEVRNLIIKTLTEHDPLCASNLLSINDKVRRV